jgi:tetratricopeptide (TPR) repeat protein
MLHKLFPEKDDQELVENLKKFIQIEIDYMFRTNQPESDALNSMDNHINLDEIWNTQSISLGKERTRLFLFAACNWVGMDYLNKQHFDQAFQAFSQSIEHIPYNLPHDLYLSVPFFNRGMTYYKRGTANHHLKDITESINDFNQAIDRLRFFENIKDIKDILVKCYRSRGQAYYKLREFGLALEDWDQALAINPNCKIVLEMLEDIFDRITKKQLREVEKDAIFSLITQLDKKKQIPLLYDCLNQDTVLGQRFWMQEDHSLFGQPCSLERGCLKEICDYLPTIYPKFVIPTNQTDLKACNPVFDDNFYKL